MSRNNTSKHSNSALPIKLLPKPTIQLIPFYPPPHPIPPIPTIPLMHPPPIPLHLHPIPLIPPPPSKLSMLNQSMDDWGYMGEFKIIDRQIKSDNSVWNCIYNHNNALIEWYLDGYYTPNVYYN